MSKKLFILEKSEDLRSSLARFFASKGFEINSFCTAREVDEGVRKFGLPDVLVVDSDYDQKSLLRLIDRMRLKIKVIVCVTNKFNDENVRLSLYLHGCTDVKPRSQLPSLYNSVIMALENEPNWNVVNVKQT